MSESENLAVVILTGDNITKNDDKRYLPKVCHKIGEQTMIEKVIDTVLQLNPSKILLILTKSNIRQINKILKYKPYIEKISLHIDNNDNNNMGIEIAKKCYLDKDILLIPGNSPLLTIKTLTKMINSNSPLMKLSDNLWFLQNEYIDYIGKFHLLEAKSFNISDIEMMEINTLEDLERARRILNKKNDPKRKQSFLKSLENNIKSLIKFPNKELKN